MCELRPGECDGWTWTDYVAAYGDPMDDPAAPFSPGGESLVMFDERCRSALDRLTTRYSGASVLMFTHGGFITAACLALMGSGGLHEDRPFWLDAKHTSITEWIRRSPDDKWSLDRFNDASHLLEPEQQLSL